MQNRPLGRQKNVTGTGKPIQKHGSGLGSGPVGHGSGSGGNYSGRRPPSSGKSSGQTRASGGGSLMKILIAAAVLLLGGGGALGGLLGGGGSEPVTAPSSAYVQQQQQPYSSSQGGASQSTSSGLTSASAYGAQGFDFASLLGSGAGNVSTGWSETPNTGKLNTSVDASAREKRTQILGNGQDQVTIMVYICGADLESRSGAASADLMEMVSAKLNDHVNVLVYTGGSKQWKNNVVSSSANQIYKVENGGLRCLVKNDGNAVMTDPKTLTHFINFCTENFPANRNELIFWDHGGGAISGYGYDEKNPRSGSMTLKKIDEALSAAGTTFDFIGFDTCLMGTLENALTLAPYADYLVASEETEPGAGWYYTNWLSAFAQNPSMPTVEVGKAIVDDFVGVCSQRCSGQKATLSVVDLAELEKTVPSKFREFALNLSDLLQQSEYKTVSKARSSTREFATSSKTDQVDLVHLAHNLDTEQSRALAQAILGAVKYNKTSANMTDAYGLAIYFPYQKVSRVDSAVSAFDAIGLDSEYTRCIQQFASMEVGGQAVSGGAASPLPTLLGSSGQSLPGMDIGSLLGSLLGGDVSGLSGFGGSGSSANFLGRNLDVDSATQYLSENRFDPAALVWTQRDGVYQMLLTEEQWSLVDDLELNVFYDDGEGYIDLGLDNVFEFTNDGALLGAFDGTWLAIDDQPVAYYHVDTVQDGDKYTITGRVPVLLNGSRADLLLVFDSDNPYGYIAGATSAYVNGETETVSKSDLELVEGDEIYFLCDYYSYDGQYQDSYRLTDAPLKYSEDLVISNVYIDSERASAMYLFTDIYCQSYWTPAIP